MVCYGECFTDVAEGLDRVLGGRLSELMVGYRECFNSVLGECRNGVLCGRLSELMVCYGECFNGVLGECCNGVLCGTAMICYVEQQWCAMWNKHGALARGTPSKRRHAKQAHRVGCARVCVRVCV